MKCQPHRISKRSLSLKERMLIFGWRVEGLSIRDIARQLGRS
ncbi:helix-turn-helix domain-containing protein, partial [uncultured Actinomyces sp.]